MAGWSGSSGPTNVGAIGLTERADELPSTFSRGLRQKAAACLAFVRPFEVMVVDEPFVGLDRAGRDALLGLFRVAHSGGATLVIATSSPPWPRATGSSPSATVRSCSTATGEADIDELVDVARPREPSDPV